MIETIIQFQDGNYPFDSPETGPEAKVEGLFNATSTQDLGEKKNKFQYLKNNSNEFIIQLIQIYQENLILHLVYEYVPFSLSTFLKQWTNANQNGDFSEEKKQLMKIFAHELNQLITALISLKIYTQLDFQFFGMLDYSFFKSRKLKYFIGNSFVIVTNRKEDLQEHYSKQRRKMLKQMENLLNFCKKSEYMPNFIIRGSRLIFTDELSDTTTRKPSKRYSEFDTQSHAGDPHNRKYSVGGRQWGNGKQKRHKKSCNFDRSPLFDNDQTNKKSFEEQSQISITQTKSIKVEIEHQKSTQKRRKNSYKFKITTTEQIQIDQDSPQIYAKSRFFTQAKERKNTGCEESGQKNPENHKDYKQKVKQAKEKAQALLNQYFKAKKKPSYK